MYKICRRNESWYIVIKKNDRESGQTSNYFPTNRPQFPKNSSRRQDFNLGCMDRSREGCCQYD